LFFFFISQRGGASQKSSTRAHTHYTYTHIPPTSSTMGDRGAEAAARAKQFDYQAVRRKRRRGGKKKGPAWQMRAGCERGAAGVRGRALVVLCPSGRPNSVLASVGWRFARLDHGDSVAVGCPGPRQRADRRHALTPFPSSLLSPPLSEFQPGPDRGPVPGPRRTVGRPGNPGRAPAPHGRPGPLRRARRPGRTQGESQIQAGGGGQGRRGRGLGCRRRC